MSDRSGVPARVPGFGRWSPAAPVHVLVALTSRLMLFAAFQAVAALAFALQGSDAPWEAAVAWWPVTVIGANLSSLALVRAWLHREGRRYRDLLRLRTDTIGADLWTTLAVLLVGGVLAMLPNAALATLLWSDPAAPLAAFVQPLPQWAAYLALVGFPLTIALSELPTYYGYVRPRVEALGLRPWLAIAFAGTMHALQHVALPLAFDARFLLWRAAMFLPFAWFVGAILRWRPRLLPYLMVAHGLLDLSVAAMVLQVSLGGM